MNRYRLTMTIDDEVEAETPQKAWMKFKDLVECHYYGPTREDVEFIEEVVEEAGTTETA